MNEFVIVDNALGAVGVAKGGQGLLEIVRSRRDGGNHDSLAVATKVVLKESLGE